MVLDVSVHNMYIAIKAGRAMDEADRRYANFMDKVVAFMNFQLGRMGARDFIDPKKGGHPVPRHTEGNRDVGEQRTRAGASAGERTHPAGGHV